MGPSGTFAMVGEGWGFLIHLLIGWERMGGGLLIRLLIGWERMESSDTLADWLGKDGVF